MGVGIVEAGHGEAAVEVEDFGIGTTRFLDLVVRTNIQDFAVLCRKRTVPKRAWRSHPTGLEDLNRQPLIPDSARCRAQTQVRRKEGGADIAIEKYRVSGFCSRILHDQDKNSDYQEREF